MNRAAPLLEADGITIAYDGRAVLEAASLSLDAGELVAIVGPNGAGKTSLLRTMAGLLRPAAGAVRIGGAPIETLGPQARGRRLAFVEAESFEPADVRVAEVVATGRYPHRPWWRWTLTEADARAVSAALAATGLETLADRPYRALSSGERQRVWIALGLAQSADVLLLDEPTSHLDVRHGFELLELLRRVAAEGRAVAGVFHDLGLAAAFADRVALLGDQMVLACGRPREVFDPALLQRAYGIPFDVVERDGRVIPFARPRSAEGSGDGHA